MIKLIKKLFCYHEWTITDEFPLVRSGIGLSAGAKIGEYTEYKCVKCDRKKGRKVIW